MMIRNSKKINKPVTNGIAKNVPIILQLEALECGAASLAMVMAYYNKWVPLEQVRVDCGVSRDGLNAKNIYQAAEGYGFKVDAYRRSPQSIMENAKFPCIIHWNFNHFVVLNGFKNNYAYINDPAKGAVKVALDVFDNAFTGVVLELEPGEEFVPSGKRKSTLSFAGKRLAGAGAVVAFVMLASMLEYLFGVINPVMSRVYVDRILSGRDHEWLTGFIAILTALSILQIITSITKEIYSLRVNGKMDIVGSSEFMWKVIRMPMEFFSQRMAGDLQIRQEANAMVSQVLINTMAPLAVNALMMFFYLFVMIRYSLFLTVVGLLAIAINLYLSKIISAKRVELMRLQLRDQGKLTGASLAGVEMIETIKASGAESGFFRKWAGYQASVNAETVKFARVQQYLGSIPQLLSTISGYLVLILGVWQCMRGEFTLGGVMAFQGFMISFMNPAMTLVEAGQTIIETRSQMERIEDVLEHPVDKHVEDKDDYEGEIQKLKGNIEIKNVTFGYSRRADPIIDDFSMSIKQGSKVAFVGTSGCGKSTIAKLISGLYDPWSGEILFDGKRRDDIPRRVISGSLAVVDQEIILFEDTISDNIRMWDESIKDFEVKLAARDAGIHDDIIRLKGGYDHKITSGGRDLSGGQRQRLEIARVLAQDPSIIILDEATSALDAKTEYEVVKAIKDRGITCIVIAHRLSTIRDCDEIVVLEHGKAVERGTHEQLLSRGGAYHELVTSE